jgi:hypothetical protein
MSQVDETCMSRVISIRHKHMTDDMLEWLLYRRNAAVFSPDYLGRYDISFSDNEELLVFKLTFGIQ